MTEKPDSSEPQTLILSDFGLSRPLTDDVVLDTLPWHSAAPETHLIRKYSTMSDVYMLGVALWELLCFQRRPFDQLATRAELHAAYERNEVPLEFSDDTSDVWRRLVKWICKIKPYARPTTDEILDRLRWILRNCKSTFSAENASEALFTSGALQIR